MAATQMSKTFLGASIKSAVPVQGKASLATLACDAETSAIQFGKLQILLLFRALSLVIWACSVLRQV